MKQRMARCKKDGSDWQQALQELRSTSTKDLQTQLKSYMEDLLELSMAKHQLIQLTWMKLNKSWN